MGVRRFFRHLFTTRWHLRRAFPDGALLRISDAVARTEKYHRGQIVVALEAALPLDLLLEDLAPKQRALQTFRLLNVWDTAENNGVLLYLCLADRDIEIVADRGIHQKVGVEGWEAICRDLEAKLRIKVSADAIVPAVDSIGALLEKHFPGSSTDQANELPDAPVVM